MPQLGESIAEATVVHLPFAGWGDEVEGDTDLLEVETNKATIGDHGAVFRPDRGMARQGSGKLSGRRDARMARR